MSDFVYRAIFVAIIGLGLSSPQVSEADGKPVHLTYAGSGINTAVDTNSDGLPVSLSQANGKGAFGQFAIAITTEFALSSGECTSSDELYLSLLSSEDVLTFSDQSQLFGISGDGDGFICLDPTTGYYHGQVKGDYVGGTGRFQGATGKFTSEFDGQYLRTDVGFRSIAGTAVATLD